MLLTVETKQEMNLETDVAIVCKINAKQRAAEHSTVQKLNELVAALQPEESYLNTRIQPLQLQSHVQQSTCQA